MVHYNKLGRQAQKMLAGILASAMIVSGTPVYAAESVTPPSMKVQNP